MSVSPVKQNATLAAIMICVRQTINHRSRKSFTLKNQKFLEADNAYAT
jgi:hypothetical protein